MYQDISAGEKMDAFNPGMFSEKGSGQAEKKFQLPDSFHKDHIQYLVI